VKSSRSLLCRNRFGLWFLALRFFPLVLASHERHSLFLIMNRARLKLFSYLNISGLQFISDDVASVGNRRAFQDDGT